ncbi:hypothetical protein O9G_003545 [Rozella allomycis CSF55]|uniref:Uncharacterized protein n=1 Tax=Rozella allomycis (strain CSF55) TaxID=988480 RepID=A0A075B0J0_ROZAC|nr:hypothetical protein O9G_003545 [Rozella allomycis CSF55]|eukprot:EPZ35900.1 hypothetical protein O9G_003545 [Rozella allomycis CSF55]
MKFLALLTFFTALYKCSDIEDEFEGEAEQPLQKLQITAKGIFPRNPFGNLVSGEKTDMLIGFDNQSAEPVSVLGVRGSFHSPENQNHVLSNLTFSRVEALLLPNSQTTVKYTFMPEIGEQDVRFIATAFIAGGKAEEIQQITVYDDVIKIVESTSGFDFQMAFLYLMGCVILGFTFVSLKSTYMPQIVKQEKVERKPQAPTTLDTDWLPTELQRKKEKVRGRKA